MKARWTLLLTFAILASSVFGPLSRESANPASTNLTHHFDSASTSVIVKFTTGPVGPPVCRPKATPCTTHSAPLAASSTTGPVGPPAPKPGPVGPPTHVPGPTPTGSLGASFSGTSWV
jgi:hypothetical protein